MDLKYIFCSLIAEGRFLYSFSKYLSFTAAGWRILLVYIFLINLSLSWFTGPPARPEMGVTLAMSRIVFTLFTPNSKFHMRGLRVILLLIHQSEESQWDVSVSQTSVRGAVGERVWLMGDFLADWWCFEWLMSRMIWSSALASLSWRTEPLLSL